jgi:hypothetical protein
MPVNKVDIYVSKILEDLNDGLTWLKRDDQGYGSIQEKYNAKDLDIAKLRLNPKLKNAETNLTIFNLIDDTDDTNESDTRSFNTATITRTKSSSDKVQQVSNKNADGHSDQVFSGGTGNPVVFSSSSADDDGLSAFADL